MNILTPFSDLFRAQTYRTLLFVVSALPISALVLGLLLSGWIPIAVLAITPLVVPLLIGYRWAVGLLARAEGGIANALLGVETVPRISSGGPGFWGRGKAVLLDPHFWKQQVYLSVRMTLGFALAIGELSLLVGALGWIGYPIWYRWSDLHFWSWQVDTFARSFVVVPAGIVGLWIGLALLRPLGRLSAWLAQALLGSRVPVARHRHAVQARRRALALHATVAAAIGAVTVVIWASTTQGYFWPEWVLMPLGLVVAIHAWIELVLEQPALLRRLRVTRPLAIQIGVSAALVAFLTGVWAVTARDYFWPEWVLLPAAILAGLHAWIVVAARPDALPRKTGLSRPLIIHAGGWIALFLFEVFTWVISNGGYFWPMWILPGAALALTIHRATERSEVRRRLAHRVEALETTRAGAVEEQDAELRRIERDLHDGAQARLVALGMSLGMAEQKLQTDPEAAHRLLAEARAGVTEALRELRDLARGVYPPVLSDRGLEAALVSLADRSPLHTTVEVSLAERPSPQVEAAIYFVAAEALANATKHSGAARVEIGVAPHDGAIEVEIRDDGRGGADPSGGGLLGLRRRVEALDGTLSVTSPAGGPTTIHAEVPCGS